MACSMPCLNGWELFPLPRCCKCACSYTLYLPPRPFAACQIAVKTATTAAKAVRTVAPATTTAVAVAATTAVKTVAEGEPCFVCLLPAFACACPVFSYTALFLVLPARRLFC